MASRVLADISEGDELMKSRILEERDRQKALLQEVINILKQKIAYIHAQVADFVETVIKKKEAQMAAELEELESLRKLGGSGNYNA